MKIKLYKLFQKIVNTLSYVETTVNFLFNYHDVINCTFAAWKNDTNN